MKLTSFYISRDIMHAVGGLQAQIQIAHSRSTTLAICGTHRRGKPMFFLSDEAAWQDDREWWPETQR